ncbi:MAG: hypothetical protein JOZ59_04285 [Candidatus Eremiobacteraeota bacterium]|nr:hypothetical protein [Candidatus Eremiobacteraeota bacterium]
MSRVFATAQRAAKLAAATIFALLVAIGMRTNAHADQALYAVTNPPVINISIGGGTVTVRTWDRPQVQGDSTIALQVQQFSSDAMARNVPREITVLAGDIESPRGLLTLPRETFVLGSGASGPHDGLAITGSGGQTTISIPASTALVVARMPHAFVTIDGYRGIFFVRLRTGWIHLTNAGGEGFVQMMRGPIVANDSNFIRLRARSAVGNILFERCHARQIEVSAIAGAIDYDNGSFEPGLARFESQYGAVALGIGSGSAQINAHTDGGRILYNYGRRVNVAARGNDASAAVGNGGPLVNVSSGGPVLLYDGALRSRSGLNGGWKTADEVINRVRQRVQKPPATTARPPLPRRPPPRLRPLKS